MKDLHNHILFDIDDGAETINDSIELLKKAEKSGYTDLILTPHYREIQDFVADNKTKIGKFIELKKAAKEENIKVKLYLGNEITIEPNILNYIRKNIITSMNGSRYYLIELPFDREYDDIHEVIAELRENGIVPIIAHPERYTYYKNTKEFEKMISEGALLQGNSSSLIGKYGDFAKKRLEALLKRHMIHFISSDIHKTKDNIFEDSNNIFLRVSELVQSRMIARELMDRNITKVIKNIPITTYQIIYPRRGVRILERLGLR